VKGIPGIAIHHLAQFKLIHNHKTITSRKIAKPNICLEYFSKTEVFIFANIQRITSETIT